MEPRPKNYLQKSTDDILIWLACGKLLIETRQRAHTPEGFPRVRNTMHFLRKAPVWAECPFFVSFFSLKQPLAQTLWSLVIKPGWIMDLAQVSELHRGFWANPRILWSQEQQFTPTKVSSGGLKYSHSRCTKSF